jgi:hypothetical protein
MPEQDSRECAVKPAAIVCVLGMHRSGTSAVARMLGLLGVHLGAADRMLPPAPDNPKGFWEHRELVAINDEILGRFDGSWDSPPALPDQWETSARLEDLRARARDVIDTELAGSALWGWKDPRTCLTLAFWQTLLPSLQHVVCVRDPLAVARSLHRRQAFSIQKTSTLWTAYTASACRQSSGRPRLVMFFEDLMSDPERELSRLARFVGAPDRLAGALEGMKDFLDESLYRHRPRLTQSVRDPDLAFPAKALYLALRSRHARREDRELQADLDEAIDLLSFETREEQSREWRALEHQLTDDIGSSSEIARPRRHAARQPGRQAESLTGRSRLESWLITAAATLHALTDCSSPRALRLALSFVRHPGRLRDAFAITASGIFDEAYYRRANADLASEPLAPLAHFVLRGAFEGRTRIRSSTARGTAARTGTSRAAAIRWSTT